ncbi:helix-turn-helix transcriptional regulator [Candidatus Poribacteria bacterium]|jgi:transcriptional regulator with XRE-family HTH domain|nr:helix-turn-helix transcriptional regulator [Candidatus Poribacteria bacterium]MBT5532088.1 helix-turn-helix transcriptional regulator [Candidatus Poribacteria bacterium]MBT5712091.1 helix-turn-helix transcriptional regulator [Candidatus Poribacteria bacterium]
MEDIAVRFGDRVRELRRERGWTQETLAAKSGLNRAYLSLVETGKRNITLRQAEVIANTFGVALGAMMRDL